MTVYNNAIPNPNDFLADSQGQIKNNFGQLDTTFGIDHVTYSVALNNGKHNQVTTVKQAAVPSTAADEPKFYAYQDATELGVLQYSRGPSDAVPTPVTMLQSPSAAIVLGATNDTSNILDFTNIVHATGMVVLMQTTRINTYMFTWDQASTSFLIRTLSYQEAAPSSTFTLTSTGNILLVKNTTSPSASINVWWTLQFFRIWS